MKIIRAHVTALLAAACICGISAVASTAWGQQQTDGGIAETFAGRFAGTASGFVVANVGESRDDITPGRHATGVFSGPMVGVTNSQTSPDDSARASTGPGVTKAFADARTAPSGSFGTPMRYAGSYWGEVVTFTGGLGELEIRLAWDIDGGVNDGDGAGSIGASIPPGAGEGVATTRFRSFVGEFNGNQNLDPRGDSSFFLKLATDNPSQNFEHPDFNIPSEPDEDSGPFDTVGDLAFDNFLYDAPEGSFRRFVEGPYGGRFVGELDAIGGGARFTWRYGEPLAIGLLLETWASDGAVNDFFSTGQLESIEVPVGTTVQTESGATYNVTFIPEPASTGVILLTGGLLAMRWPRRR